ncbi:MAG TPA: hypothetical protein VJR06_08620 [Nitrososphaerales archaeon]|nr:hypothetical protein [Nitrososphaerales archaeon]
MVVLATIDEGMHLPSVIAAMAQLFDGPPSERQHTNRKSSLGPS